MLVVLGLHGAAVAGVLSSVRMHACTATTQLARGLLMVLVFGDAADLLHQGSAGPGLVPQWPALAQRRAAHRA